MWRQCAFTCGHTGATWRIRLNLCFLRPTRVTIQTANRSVRPFLHISRQKVPILTMGYSFPQNCPSDEVSGPPSNTWFPGPTQVLNPNGISIGSAVFAGITSVTDRPTDRPSDHATRSVPVTTDRIYVTYGLITYGLEFGWVGWANNFDT